MSAPAVGRLGQDVPEGLVRPAPHCPLQRYSVDPEAPDCALMANCEMQFTQDESIVGRQYANVRCRALFENGNGDGMAPPDWSEEERSCVDVGDRCPNYDSAFSNDQHPWVPLYFVVASAKVRRCRGRS